MYLKLICQSLHNNHSQPIWINKSTAIYNHWSFIKCPKKTNHLQFLWKQEPQRAREWENSKQAKCTAYTRATAMKSFLRINTDDEHFWTNRRPLTIQSSWMHSILIWLPALLRLWE